MSKTKKIWDRFSEWIDGPISVLSPSMAASRSRSRFMYDVLERTRIQAKRSLSGGSGDFHLEEHTLQNLRETSREVSRNNPLAVGLLRTERDAVVGNGLTMQSRAESDQWDKTAERLWKEQMVEEPCDITRRYNFTDYLRKGFMAKRRDGDFATVFTDRGLQAIEGEQIGTPTGIDIEGKETRTISGVVFSKGTGELIGYYIGEPDRWGFVTTNYQKYLSDDVHFMLNADRFSQSRGEPVLTQSIEYIDLICGKNGYLKAEAVRLLVNACYTIFVSRKSNVLSSMPEAFTGGVSPSGLSETGKRLQKVEPGLILYGEDDENATGIGQPGSGAQDPFLLRVLGLIGRPLCMPLVMVTGDFSGATFMNMRIAYQKAQDNWKAEQYESLVPLGRRAWRWHIDRNMAAGRLRIDWLKDPDRKYRVDPIPRIWPYVDPEKEANANKIQLLENRTISRKEICAGEGREYDEVESQLAKEEAAIPKPEPATATTKDVNDGNK